MNAKLTAIHFDRATEEYLQRALSENEADQCALAEMGNMGDLSHSPALLNKLPAGDYVLILSGEFDRDPSTRLHLLNRDTGEVMHTAVLDLTPIMQSALEDDVEFDALMGQIDADNDEERVQADEQLEAQRKQRAQQVEGALSPFIENDASFNVELMDMLDYLSYPMIKGSVSSDIEMESEPDASPESAIHEAPSLYAYNKHTLH